MRHYDKLAVDAGRTFNLAFKAEILTIMNPTRQTVMIGTGGPSIPDTADVASLIVPPFASIAFPVVGTSFGIRLGSPESPNDPLGQTHAWIFFTAGEQPPMLGSLAMSQVELTNEILEANVTIQNSTLPVDIQNATLAIEPAAGAEPMKVDIQNASVEVNPAAGSTFEMNLASADVTVRTFGYMGNYFNVYRREVVSGSGLSGAWVSGLLFDNQVAHITCISLFVDQSTTPRDYSAWVTIEQPLGNIYAYLAEVWSKSTERTTLTIPCDIVVKGPINIVGGIFKAVATAVTFSISVYGYVE